MRGVKVKEIKKCIYTKAYECSKTYARILFNEEVDLFVNRFPVGGSQEIVYREHEGNHIFDLFAMEEVYMGKQFEYCEKNNVPMFAPEGGKCFYCKKMLTDTDKEHVTKCRNCARSFLS